MHTNVSPQSAHHESRIGGSKFQPEIYTSSTQDVGRRSWRKVQNWLEKDAAAQQDNVEESLGAAREDEKTLAIDLLMNPASALSRPAAAARSNIDTYDRVCVFGPGAEERRAVSLNRRTTSSQTRSLSLPPYPLPSSCSPFNLETLPGCDDAAPPLLRYPYCVPHVDSHIEDINEDRDQHDALPEESIPFADSFFDGEDDSSEFQEELEARWILNLSLHFKDRTDREKFFITYAEQVNKWRRITVSIDYRNTEEESLEKDLKMLRYQRDKSARIYQSIRDSLLDIQFYPTVTNLKLKTSDGRLHVHCSEDLNEIISYPRASMLDYLPFPVFREADLLFVSHISGFVYKINNNGRIMVKKEIPGPDSVDEFLYEVTALSSLRNANHVIDFEGLVVDDSGKEVRGLLLSYASKGALVDLLFDGKQTHNLPWSRREKWARQIVYGLSEIHEAGFVQGDFTLSNIVADNEDNVWLIDINRRGCPVGWEPPELETLIRSGQHISMFIGVKTDLFQLGMVLWAVANCVDEPERIARPLPPLARPDIPPYFCCMVELCLQSDPRKRPSASDLLALFPKPDLNADSRAASEVPLFPVFHAEPDPSSCGGANLLSIRPASLSLEPHAQSQVSDFSSNDTHGTSTVVSSR